MAAACLVMRIMASSIMIANRSGQIIRDVMSNGELGIVEKGKDDLQTEADRSAQRCIVASLTNQFPGVKIIGEEGYSEIKDIPRDWNVTEQDTEFLQNVCPDSLKDITENDLVIWVDPLDGTSEYTKGFLEHVTVLIGLSIRDRAVGGVLHQPYYKAGENKLGRTIWGLKGLGTGGFEPITPPANSLIVTTTRSHSNELVQSALQSLQPTEVLRVGGAGYKVLQLLEGNAHAYVFASPGCKKWDTCAPEAILEAAGGTLTDIRGNHYTYGESVSFPNRLGVIATAKTISHSEIIDKLPESIKQALDS